MAKAKTQKKANPSSSAPPPERSQTKATKAPGPKAGSKVAANGGVRPKAADALLQTIQDLGGDAEDYALINGIDDGEGEEDVVGGDEVVDAKLSNELASFMKGLDFSQLAATATEDDAALDNAASSDNDQDDDDEEEDEYEEESDEGEMPMDTPKAKPKKEEAKEDPKPEPSREKVDVKAAVAKVQGTGINAAPLGMPMGMGSLLKGKNGELIFPALPQWYLHTLPPLDPSAPLPPLTQTSLSYLSTKSTQLLESLPTSNKAPTLGGSKSDANFLSQILKSGTQADKLSALILLVQGDPLRNLSALDGLRAMTGYKKEDGTVGRMGGREERIGVVRAIADWWNGGGAPNRKLRYLRDQPMLTHPGATDAHLTLWAFEDWLKKYFYTLLQVLETLSHDTLPFVRTQTINIVFQLLKEKPEQEQNLLRLLVNKLGDTDKTVASRASYHLLQLLQSHPAMKSVVVREVSSLVLVPPPAKVIAPSKQAKKQQKKKGKGKAPPMAKKTTVFDTARDDSGNLHARYYGIITLNQTTLTVRDGEVAGKLVEVYFEVFKGILGDGKGKEEEEPIEKDEAGASEAGKAGKEHKGKGAWKGKGKKSDPKEDEVEDSDAKMIAAVLSGVNRALPFAKIDENVLESHLDTLFRITHNGTFNISIQALNLIQQVVANKEPQSDRLTDRFFRTLYESLLDPRLTSSSKQAMYLNLLFKAMKADPLPERRAAFVKRTIQILGMHQPPFICGALYLLGELFSSTPGLRRMLSEPEDDDDEEHFVDAPDSDVDEAELKEKAKQAKKPIAAVPAAEKKWDTNYDGKKRDPKFAHAEGSCLWELTPFLTHFHPSVSLHASQLLANESITTSSDLNLNTLIHFLDRFVYRNAKKPKAKGASIMQPAAASDKSGVVLMMKGSNGGEAEVNSKEFWRKDVEDVPVDQLFFHKFFTQKLGREKAKADKVAKRKGGDDDEMSMSGDEAAVEEDLPRSNGKQAAVPEPAAADEDDSDDEEEKEIWKAMQSSMPNLEEDEALIGDSDGDDDDLSELGSDEMASLDGDDDEGSDGQVNEAEFGSEDEEVFDMDEDEDDILPSDDESAFVSAFPPEEDEAVEDVVPQLGPDGKRKRNNAEERKERKKKRRLPTFGDYEAYQKLIDDGGPEDNI